jgi:ribosomal protein S18 acetylase RimI-like enzyme
MLENYEALVRRQLVHVFDQGGTVRALLVLVPQTEAMLLDNVAVSPDSQGQGLGRQLIDFAEQTAVASGYRSIKLYTNEAMTENIAAYSKMGYAETHRAVEHGLRRVYMAKTLTE